MNYPKSPRQKNPHLLRMAQGETCLLQIPNVCNGNSDTVVAAHSNSARHGKGMAIKSHDGYTVWACSSCHCWLDIGVSTRAEKEAAFAAAFERQRKAWADIAWDEKQPAKDRNAAKWALERVDAYIESADRKLLRALKLSRNSPASSNLPDQTEARIMMRRKGHRNESAQPSA